MDGPAWLEVWRGRKTLLAGTPGEILEAARRGQLRWSDAIRVPESGATFRPHEIPFLAPFVPTQLEEGTRRNLRTLYVLDAIVLPIMLLGLAVAWLTAGLEGLRNAVVFVFVFAVLFVAPIPALRARLRQYRELRARGLVPREEVPTTGDPGLDALLRRPAPLTKAIVVVVSVVSVAAFQVPGLAEVLKKSNAAIDAGEWWRLVTPALLHGGLLHLVVNMLAMSSIGATVEHLYGRGGLLAVFLVGTAGASLASYSFTAADSVGASGGLFALVGALLVFGLRHRAVLPPAARDRLLKDMGFVVVVNLAIGFTATFIDNAAHVGGLATGAALAVVLRPSGSARGILGRARRVAAGLTPRDTAGPT